MLVSDHPTFSNLRISAFYLSTYCMTWTGFWAVGMQSEPDRQTSACLSWERQPEINLRALQKTEVVVKGVHMGFAPPLS